VNILITICARGGSKGIPGKNIKFLAGKPLIAYTISTAMEFINSNKEINFEIGFSTDSTEIANVAQKYGIDISYKRPDFLATDEVGKMDAIIDIINYKEKKLSLVFDYVLDLDVTSPLRNVNDLSNAYQILNEDARCLNLFSVNKAHRNPYFNMVEEKENGYYGLVKSKGDILSRQKTPLVYDLNASFYFFKKEFFELGLKTPICSTTKIYVMPHICFDLDENIDFEFLSFLIENNKLDFIL
jgi:CMP-N-acetylneuraminic acid synthetase